MKVCLLNDSFPPVIDGVANVVMNYAKIMTEQNLADVMVGTPRYPDANYDSYPYPVVPFQSFDTTGIVSGYRAGNPFDMKACQELIDFEPDIIHTHCPVTSTLVARIIRNKTKAPIVFTYHTKFDVDISRAVKAEFLRNESIKTLVDNISACDEVWVVSKGAGENLVSLGYEGEYHVAVNGVDFAKGKVDDETVQRVTKDYDLPGDVPIFLFVGRIMKYKGLPLILEACKMLSQKGLDYRMVFVGDGPDAAELKEQIKEDGTADKVIFTGAIRDRLALRAWNTRADLFLFPSTYDTNGIVVREAAACGLASVLIKDSCAAEGITNGRNGFIIQEEAEAMFSLLSQVCKNKDRVKQVGENAMNEIYISWEDAVKMAHERYDEIIEMKACGLIPTKKWDTSELPLRIATNMVGVTDKVFNTPKRIYEGMMENVGEMWEDIKRTKDNVVEDIKRTKDNVVEGIKRKWDD